MRIRLPFGTMTIDQAEILQKAVIYERQRYPERHVKHINYHISLRNRKKQPRLCRCWVILDLKEEGTK